MTDEPGSLVPERLQLEHRLFTTFGDFTFCRSATDGAAVMSVNLGDRAASITVKSLRRELEIDEGTPDGRMLDLVVSALEYVSRVQPGDKLPLEIRTGQASWSPEPEHIRVATNRLHLRLADWHVPNGRWSGAAIDGTGQLTPDDALALHDAVAEAAWHGAQELGLPVAGDVFVLLESLAHELSFIEALRARLLLRVETTGRTVTVLAQRKSSTASMSETTRQVSRLICIAYRQLRARFDDVDAQTGEIVSVLRNLDSQRRFIRLNRDWLYRHHRAWEPLLTEWQAPPAAGTDDLSALFTRTYQFLARRFMPTTEWHVVNRPRDRHRIAAGMRW